MADTPPWLEYQSPRAVTMPLGPRDPNKVADLELKREQLAKARKDALKAEVGDKEIETLARMYAANKLVPPTRPNEVAQMAIARAMELDPNYDPELAGNRSKAIKDFSGNGQASQVVRSVNRLASHLNDMYQASEKMGGPNLHVRALNKMVAGVEQQGMPETVAAYDAAKPFVATELEKIMKGVGQPTVSGIEEATKGLDRARSLDERRAAFKQIAALVHGALEPIKQSWNSAYGGNRAPPMWVSPQAAKVFGHIDPENADTFGGDDWRGLPGLKGVGDQPTLPPGDSGAPPPDDLAPATGETRTEMLRGPVEKKLAAMLASGSPSANIRAFARANDFPAGKVDSVLAWRAMNPKYKGAYDVSTERIVPTTAYNRAAASPIAAGVLAAVNSGTAGMADEGAGAINALRTGQSLSDSIAAADFGKQMLARANPKATLAGDVVGGTAAMLGGGLALRGLGVGAEGSWLAANPMKAAALGDMAYGGAYGAGENNDNRALGAGVGAGTALVASPLGQLGAKALGGAIRGVANPAVDRLRAAGIPLTVGEVLGGGWKKAQDAMTSVFGPGNMVERRYADGRRALNEAAFNQAGEPIGASIDAVGQEGIQRLEQAKDAAYSKALDPVSLNLNTPSFTDPMRGILDAASAIPAGELPPGYAANSIKRFVGNNIMPDGTMAGRDFQTAYRGLAQTANRAAPKVEGPDVSAALGQAKDILTSALEEQNPGAFSDFLNANAAHRHGSVLSKALEAAQNQVSDAGEQLFTPAQLGRAATNNARTFGGKAAASSGNRPFNQLALDAQQVMSSKIPDSGTPGRLLMMKGLATLGAAGAPGVVGYGADGTEGGVEGAGLGLGALSLLGTRRGQQLLTAALLKRIAPFRRIGDATLRNPQLGGDVLTAAGIPLLSGQ